MSDFKNYFDDIVKIDPTYGFIIGIKNKSTLSHYTNYLSDSYLKQLYHIYKKYKNKNDSELKLHIDYIKYHIKYKIYLYNLLTSYENHIISFEYDNKIIYPPNKSYELSRKKDFKLYIKTLIARLKESLKLKITVPRLICKNFLKQIEKYKDYSELYDYIKHHYLNKCRKTIGLCHLPNGKNIYKILILNNLGFYKSPKQVHNLGLKLIKKPMNAVAHFYSSREEFFKDCLKYSLYIYEVIIDKYFYYKPPHPFIIKKVPEELEHNRSLAYYNDIENAVFINLRFYKECNKNTLYSLLMHECFHQYHYLFMKYHKLPIYKIHGYNNITLLEGFAHYMEIYCENYDDDNNEYSLLRKMRLVVDTGINYYGWTYDKAFNYMNKYMPNRIEDNKTELNRYIDIPAQSLCYVIGKYEIIKMRDNFIKNKKGTIKDFHHKLLINGTTSLKFIKNIL